MEPKMTYLTDNNIMTLKMEIENLQRTVQEMSAMLVLLNGKQLISGMDFNSMETICLPWHNQYYNGNIVNLEWVEETVIEVKEEVPVVEDFEMLSISLVSSPLETSTLITEDYISTGTEGRGSKVETLTGGMGLGYLDDLEYFKQNVERGLSKPTDFEYAMKLVE